MRELISKIQLFAFKGTLIYMRLNNILKIILFPIALLICIFISIICWIIFLLHYVPKYGFKEGWNMQIKDQMKHVNNFIEESMQ